MEETDMHLHNEEQDVRNSAFTTDVVIGLSDGLAVPFALAAGLSRVVDSSGIILLAGIAAIAAGSASMGIGGYFASKEEAQEGELKAGTGHIEMPAKKEEVKTFFANLGLSEEMQQQATDEVIKDKEKWADYVMQHHHETEQQAPQRAVKSGWNIALAYVVGGLVPLSPYFFMHHPMEALKISAIVTLISLFVFGWLKGKFTGINPWEGGLRVTIIGALAAGAAFMVARLFGS